MFDRIHPRRYVTDDCEPYREKVEAALPGVGQLDGGVVEVGVDHAGQDRDEGLHARHHREHLGHEMDRSPLPSGHRLTFPRSSGGQHRDI